MFKHSVIFDRIIRCILHAAAVTAAVTVNTAAAAAVSVLPHVCHNHATSPRSLPWKKCLACPHV